MTLPTLLFQGGTHGNFLSRCLTVASSVNEDFDFYKNKKGAHNKQGEFIKVVDHIHECNDDNVFAYINIKLSDLYILNWHVFFAAGEFGIDVLTTKNFDKLIKVINHKSAHPVVVGGFATQVNIFKDDGILGLREMFKRSFAASNGLITEQDDIFNKHNMDNIFEFSWFYDQNFFCKQVEKLLVDLGYDYKVDILHHQQEFIDKKLDILQSKKLVEHAFNCYTNNISMDISNFCIYEQAYLDYLIEQHLGYEIENWEEYPKNTKNIKPTESWEGVRYEL
tara:strand:+ start:260 stop:1096 length:837 start_codon:yes stop_codon:yes gene_type:complete